MISVVWLWFCLMRGARARCGKERKKFRVRNSAVSRDGFFCGVGLQQLGPHLRLCFLWGPIRDGDGEGEGGP